MRSALVVVWMLFGTCVSAAAQISIGINLPLYPELVPVPGYPVYYAPQLDSNFFWPKQGASPRESQPSHLREQTDRPSARAPEPRRDPEHDRGQ
jgi:hypothetical protein